MGEEVPKKIEVVTGDGKNLEFSEVSSHLNVAKPKIKDSSDKQEIVIPKPKKKIENTAKK